MKPPSRPEPVAATSSGTGRSYGKIKKVTWYDEVRPTPFLASENVILAMGPWAGNESRSDRWTTALVLLEVV